MNLPTKKEINIPLGINTRDIINKAFLKDNILNLSEKLPVNHMHLT